MMRSLESEIDKIELHQHSKKIKNYFAKEMLALKVFGLSLSGSEGILYRIYSVLILSITVFIYPVLDFYEYFKHDVSVVSDIIVYQTAAFMSLCKTGVVLRNRRKFAKVLAKLEKEPFAPNPSRGGLAEEKLVNECIWLTKAQFYWHMNMTAQLCIWYASDSDNPKIWISLIQTFTYWAFASVTITATILYTFAKRIRSSDYHDWQFPYGPFTMINVTYSPNYEISCLYQGISIIYISSLFIAIDLLLAAVLAHISYQFKILQNYLRRLVEISAKKMVEDTTTGTYKFPDSLKMNHDTDNLVISWKYLQQTAKEAIDYHLAIINLATEIEEVFSDLLLLVFLGTLALLCFTVYAASSVGSNLELVGKHVGEGTCACLQVATVCFWGEQVMQESEQVGRAAYESNFVGTDLRFQKMLTLIVRRSQTPTKLTAGKFANICLSTFAWILRTSYSSFMVLRQADN